MSNANPLPRLLSEPFKPTTEEDWELLAARAWQVFRPAAPIDNARLFAGRVDQVLRLMDVIYQAGAHAIIYGERGVGKTSLCNIIKDKLMGEYSVTKVIRVGCDAMDTFPSIWKKVFFGHWFAGEMASDLIAKDPQPFTVFKIAEELAADEHHLVILDEFDRVVDESARMLVADTIKYLSDNPIRFTIVIVGVGGSIDQLFGLHPSISRCCSQIQMPRMSAKELGDILDERLPSVHLTIADSTKRAMIHQAKGLPGYMHLLGQLAARSAINRRVQHIDLPDFGYAMRSAIEHADESARRDYLKATDSASKDNIYKEVLLACALANTNTIGEFSASGVSGPLSKILKREVKIPHYARHLKAFCEPDRGPVLVRTGSRRRFRYQFANPLLQPLALMKGFSDGLLTLKGNSVEVS